MKTLKDIEALLNEENIVKFEVHETEKDVYGNDVNITLTIFDTCITGKFTKDCVMGVSLKSFKRMVFTNFSLALGNMVEKNRS